MRDGITELPPYIYTIIAENSYPSLVLYDVTSTYLEGNGCELVKYGYNRDKKKGKTQIVFGLLCSAKGCPIAVEVFEGNTSDGATLAGQIEKVINGLGD